MTKTKRGSKSGDAVVDHQECGSRVRQLEEENKAFQKENEELRYKLANVSSPSGDSSQKIREEYLQKLILLEDQVAELKKKLDAKSQLSIQRPKGDEATKRLNFEIQSLKAQKVQLQCKMKLESLQFRSYKASKEKEVLQLRKDGRRNQFETRKLLDSNQRLNMVLQRKTIEASMATKRLKELLESRKSFLRKRAGVKHIPRLQGLEYDLEVSTKLHELCSEYERQMEVMAEEIASHKEEVEVLKQENLTLLQEKEADTTKDLDIKDLNEQIASLSGLFRQLRQQKAELDSSNKSQGVPSQSSLTSIRSNQLVDITTSGSECSRPSKSASGVCCSCSKKSLCKTTKCQCRQNGGSCGASCGCTAAKCTNREAVQIQLSNSPQSQITEGKVDCSTIVEPAKNTTEDASQIALVEKPAETNDNNLSTKPLSDIGNMLVKRNDTRPGQRKKGGKAVIQVVSEVAPSSTTTTNSAGGGSKEAGKNKKVPRTTRSKVTTSE